MPVNEALWKPSRGGALKVGPASYPVPGPDQVVVRVRAVAVNPVDRLSGVAFRFVAPWLTFPAVPGSDVAGEIAEVGSAVTRLHVGDRVTGHAYGFEKGHDHAGEGAFQAYAVLAARMVAPIPDDLAFEKAAVLPLALSTAATALFQRDHLGLARPELDAADRGETVLVWGASTSVGCNAVQLARCAGYRVVATASPRNFDYVRSLGADAVVDYRGKTAVRELIAAVGGGPLAGAFAIGKGSLVPTIAVAAGVPGARRVASSLPATPTRLVLLGRRRHGVHVSGVWGSTLSGNEVGPAVYEDFLPAALAAKQFQPAPREVVAGEGLAAIPAALDRLGRGVSAQKLVVRLP